MQLILDTENSIDISRMTELKDNIREKLVNNIMEDLSLCSSDKENIENPENFAHKGTNGDDSNIDELPAIKLKQEQNDSEYNDNSVRLENNDESDNTEKHNENQVESQNESSSPNKNNEQCISELKHILKQEVLDIISHDENEETDSNVPDENNMENNDSNVNTVTATNIKTIDSDNHCDKINNYNDKELDITETSKDIEKVTTDVTDFKVEQDDTSVSREMDEVSMHEDVDNVTELSNSTDESVMKEELSYAIDQQLQTEEIIQNSEGTTITNDDEPVETVVIDDKDISMKVNDSMETVDIEERVKEASANIEETEDITELTENSTEEVAKAASATELEVSTSDVVDETKEEVVVVEETPKETTSRSQVNDKIAKEHKIEQPVTKKASSICRLSNTLDILSDDDEDPPKDEAPKTEPPKDPQKPAVANLDNQCINIEDDDIMFVEEDIPSKSEENKTEEVKETLPEPPKPVNNDTSKIDEETGENKSSFMESIELVSNKNDADSTVNSTTATEETQAIEKPEENNVKKTDIAKPLLPDNILTLSKKKLSDMSREELEEFCILKIVEGIMDRGQLNDTRSKLQSMAKTYEDQRAKLTVLTKQNKDLQVILKSVQEEQKKINDTYKVITPLKITRSVGMQVLLPDKVSTKRKSTSSQASRASKSPAPTRAQKPAAAQNIPVPRLVPASNTGIKSPTTSMSGMANGVGKSTTAPNGYKAATIQKVAEKRPFSRVQQAVTVDLTDDEPPAKVPQRSSPAPPVRVVPSHNLMPSPRPNNTLNQMLNSPRKVFIPIGAQGQGIRPGPGVMLKTMPNGPKPRPMGINAIRPQNQVRARTASMNRHPAPLPDATKQYQPPNWKALPPAPDLKLSKVENGIVISWKIDGYQEDLYEQIASYQLYAYQETSSPPSTALWKKIGDVKALPLPMACTLTQFTAGFKYFFAVRAVDVRSRLGPFSLPGSILLLQKM